jgi:hypothetical protein
MARDEKKPGGPSTEDLERLYMQPPEKFTAERDALAKRLRDEGDREAAQETKKLRRPSLAAWLVNQLSLRQGKDVEKLLDAGERLRAAENAMLSGAGEADELRAAAAAERDAVEELVATAREIADGDGRKLNQATLDRVAETLQAAGADEDVAALVRDGRLAKETRRASIGTGALPSGSSPRRSREGGPGKADREDQDRRAAKAALDGARRDLERAEGVVERAQGDVEVHTARLREAKEALARAKREARRAATETRRAEARAKKR